MTRDEAIAILEEEAEYLYQDDEPYNRKAFEMAIKALSQEPCDDAISRDAVLDALLDYWHDIQFVDGSGYDVYEDCKTVIDELPSVTQKSGKWINVNDMLPREREDVLVTCFVHENWQTKIGYWNGKAWVVNAYDILFIDRLEVTAWMPLPKPYEPQESEE